VAVAVFIFLKVRDPSQLLVLDPEFMPEIGIA
jgi:hypothetical protein